MLFRCLSLVASFPRNFRLGRADRFVHVSQYFPPLRHVNVYVSSEMADKTGSAWRGHATHHQPVTNCMNIKTKLGVCSQR